MRSRRIITSALAAAAMACTAPTPSAPPASDRIIRVLALNYDPIAGGRRLHDVLKWSDPRQLAAGYADDLATASGHSVGFEIVEWRDIDAIPRKADGFQYTTGEYLDHHREGRGWHDADPVDFRLVLKEQHVTALVDARVIDEVWLFGGPYFGYSESAMAGTGAFYINGAVLDDVPAGRPFAIMGFNYERGVAEMLEDLCHRTESTMSRLYAGWRPEALEHNWARFAASAAKSGSAGVGSCHWPPNAEREYDWDNPRVVMSTADAWLRYPDLTAPPTPVNRDSWGGPDYARNYFRWWFAHLPRHAGIASDGRLNNWWEYVVNFSDYDERGRPRR